MIEFSLTIVITLIVIAFLSGYVRWIYLPKKPIDVIMDAVVLLTIMLMVYFYLYNQ